MAAPVDVQLEIITVTGNPSVGPSFNEITAFEVSLPGDVSPITSDSGLSVTARGIVKAVA